MAISQQFKIYAALLQLFLTIYFVTAEVNYENGVPIVKLSQNAELIGDMKLSRDGRNYSSFMGIPFGSIKHRFAHPDLIKDPSWNGQRNATVAGAFCPQKLPFGGSYIVGNEFDCLNLNVYVPIVPGNDLLPVMVWIPPGAFQYGRGAIYGAKYFMDEDIILVTINYRMGVFGFLSTGDEVVPGNNGLKDQVVALEWVQKNIEKFGGDPLKVTVFGQSSGSASIHYLLLSPTTKGLFHRAIAESGVAIGPWAFDPDPKMNAIKLSNYMGCPINTNRTSRFVSQVILMCLRGKSSEELLKAQNDYSQMWPPQMPIKLFAPVSEHLSTRSPFLTIPPHAVINYPINFLDIPLMLGFTEDEAAMGVPRTPEQISNLDTHWNELFPKSIYLDTFMEPFSVEERASICSQIRRFYFKDEQLSMDQRNTLINLYSDGPMDYGVRKVATLAASKGNTVYIYEYAYNGMRKEITNPVYHAYINFFYPTGDDLVGHGEEIFTLFDTVDVFPLLDNTELIPANSTMEEMSKNMVKLWASFAKDGKPTHTWGNATDRVWTKISKAEADGTAPLKFYKLNENPGFFNESVDFLERMNFWDKLWSEYFIHGVFGETSGF